MDPLARLARGCTRHPWVTVLVLAAATVGFVAGAPAPERADLDEVFVPEELPSRQAADRIADTFGETTPALVLFDGRAPTDPDVLRAQARLADQVADPTPVEARSLAHAVEQATGQDPRQLSDEDLQAAAEEVTRRPQTAGLVGEEASLLVLGFPADADERAIVDATQAGLEGIDDDLAGLEVTASGPAHLTVDQRESGEGDLQVLMPLAGLVLLVVLYATFRRASDVGVCLATVFAATGLAYAALPWLGVPFSPLLFSVAPLIVGLGVDYVLHIVYAYQDEAATQRSAPAAMERAVHRVGRPVAFTVVTTCIGFGSFLASPIPQIQHWGALIGSGALAAFVLGFTLLPAAVGLRDREQTPEDRRPGWPGAIVDKLADGVGARPIGVLAGLAILTVAAGAGVASVDVAESVAQTDTTTPAERRLDRIEATVGTQASARVLVEGEAGDLREPLDELSQALADRPGVEALDSPTQRARAQTNGSLPAEDTYRELVAEGPPGELTADGITVIELRYDDGDPEAVFDAIRDTLETSPLEAQLTGSAVIREDSSGLILPNLVRSTGVALALVGVTLAAIHRSWRWTALAAAPLGLVLVWQFGAMGALGVDLNPVTGVTTAMVIGIGVDYTIHTTQATRRALAEGRSGAQAARAGLGEVGRPVLAATVTTTGAFLVLAVSNNPQVAQFGRVAAVVIASAFLASLTSVPALVTLFGPETDDDTSEADDPAAEPEARWRLHRVQCPACGASGALARPRSIAAVGEATCRACGGAVPVEGAGRPVPSAPEVGPFQRCLRCRARWSSDGRAGTGVELERCPRCGEADDLRRVQRVPWPSISRGRR